MRRGKEPDVQGLRMDTRKHTRHCLRPSNEIVTRLLSPDDDFSWSEFRVGYLRIVRERFKLDRAPFQLLAEKAAQEDVYLGCSCPTKRNPNVYHCHTILALEFMQENFPHLDVLFPPQQRHA